MACGRRSEHLGRCIDGARVRRQRQAAVVARCAEVRKRWAIAEETLLSLQHRIETANDAEETKSLQVQLQESILRRWLVDDASQTMLLVDTGENVNLERASRNLYGVTLVATTALEPYELLRHERLLMSRPAAERLSRSLRVNKSGDAATAPVQIQAAPAAEKAHAEAAEKPAKSKAKKAAPKAHKAAAKPKKTAKPKGKKE